MKWDELPEDELRDFLNSKGIEAGIESSCTVNTTVAGGGDSAEEGLLVDIWEERDRLGIWVTDAQTGDIVFEVWDDDARQLFEDGFFKPGKAFKESVVNYVKERI